MTTHTRTPLPWRARSLGVLLLMTVAISPQAWANTPELVKAARQCAELADIDLSELGGQGSRTIRASENNRDGIPVCAVEGRLAPSITFKLTLPTQSWRQRYLQIGCGGLCGRVAEEVGAADGCVPLATGDFAIASTDMGHQGMGGSFGRDPQKREDFAHRAVHLTALSAKKLIRSYYGRSEAYAYFTGCSDGGREALMEAQRYPDDFNGIIAGAAAMNFQVQNGLYHAWQARANTGLDGKPILTASRLPLLHRTVLAQCDALDGQADGLIADPRICHFDSQTLQCPTATDAEQSNCLSATEVAAARQLYDGPRDAATGQRLTPGGPQPGSELAWAGVFVPRSANEPIFSEKIALDALLNLSFETNPKPGFSLADVRFDKAGFDALRALHPLYDATNPDLSAFASAGHKLILWHGWSDPHISPINTIAYHEALKTFMGQAGTAAFERLYLLPGVYHCSGGEGPSAIDLLTPMMDWVEKGQAPDAIIARQAPATLAASGFGQPTTPPAGMAPPPELEPPAKATADAASSRAVFPYPAVASYDKRGAPDQASSYIRGTPLVPEGVPAWMGSDFYSPYRFR